MNAPVKKRRSGISSNAPEGASAGARSREPAALFQEPEGVPRRFQVSDGSKCASRVPDRSKGANARSRGFQVAGRWRNKIRVIR